MITSDEVLSWLKKFFDYEELTWFEMKLAVGSAVLITSVLSLILWIL